MRTSLLVPLIAATGLAAAGDAWSAGYLGAGAGESKFDRECGNTNVFSCDQRDTAWKIYGGGDFNEVLGYEVGYTDFGKIRASGGETKAWAVPISLTAGVPLGPVRLFGKAGGLFGRTDVNVDPSTLFGAGHKNGWGWIYGVGTSFAVSPTVALRAEWERYKLDFAGGRDDVDMLSAGVQVRF